MTKLFYKYRVSEVSRFGDYEVVRLYMKKGDIARDLGVCYNTVSTLLERGEAARGKFKTTFEKLTFDIVKINVGDAERVGFKVIRQGVSQVFSKTPT